MMHANGSTGAEVPVVDHVAGLSFDYFDESHVPLGAAALVDGPWLPNATSITRWDADLRRVRTIGITFRVEAAPAMRRGPAGMLFRNGGTATAAAGWTPDQEVRFDVSPRNLSLRR